MNTLTILNAANINKFALKPIIVAFAKRYQYDAIQGKFDIHITCVIQINGYYKTFRFKDNKSFDDAVDYIYRHPDFKSKDLKQFTM